MTANDHTNLSLRQLFSRRLAWAIIGALVFWFGTMLIVPDRWGRIREQARDDMAARGVRSADELAEAQVNALQAIDRRLGGFPDLNEFVHSTLGGLTLAAAGAACGLVAHRTTHGRKAASPTATDEETA